MRILLITITLGVLLAWPAAAQTPPDFEDAIGPEKETVELTNPLAIDDPGVLIGRIISAALGIVGSVALVIFIYGGFIWMSSAGNMERVRIGKNVLVWATVGLAVIFSSYALVRFVLGEMLGLR